MPTLRECGGNGLHLERVVDEYCLSNEISADYAYQLRYAVSRFGRFLGRPGLVSDLEPAVVNRWLVSEQDTREIGDRSRRNIRTSIITIAKYAGGGVGPENVRRVTVPSKAPRAWSVAQFRDVAAAANELPGVLKNGVARSAYFATILWFCYETGLRRRDAWSFSVHLLDDEHRAAVTQHKTGRVHVIEVTPETHEDLTAISKRLRSLGNKRYGRPLAWPHSSTSTFYYWMARVREIAGVDPDVVGRSLQHVRRTGATAVECGEAGTAWQYLGHAGGPRLSWASYIDPTKAKRSRMPPVKRHHGLGRTNNCRKK